MLQHINQDELEFSLSLNRSFISESPEQLEGFEKTETRDAIILSPDQKLELHITAQFGFKLGGWYFMHLVTQRKAIA